MTGTCLFDRRQSRVGDVGDRRRTARGGRRASDVAGHVVRAVVATLALASTAHAQPPQGWTTSGTRILTSTGGDFVITGLNWYGFETTSYVARGLFSRDYAPILNDVKQYGFNTLRIPFSNEMWETNPLPAASQVSACPSCAGKRARDILAMIVNYAGSIGLHVILDNHRSTAGNSPQENGLWYATGYPERSWIGDWVDVQAWSHGIQQTTGAADTVTVSTFASDGVPTVIGFDLRNEPHSPASYPGGATWGTGDGVDPAANPNPNPFAPACVATSTCHDWRLAAERAADTLLGRAAANQWAYPLLFVEGVQYYPQPGGTANAGPYDNTWWGANLLGVNGNSTNPGAPVVVNAGGDATALGPPVSSHVVYSVHDYGPALYPVAWFNSNTCYATGCSTSSLTDVWTKYWAHLTFPGGIRPVWPGHASYPWSNTGHDPVDVAPVYIGEFGTGNQTADLVTTGAGSQGQWMTSLVNFIESSYPIEGLLNDSGVPVSNLHWTYWSLNGDDMHALLGANYAGLANPTKEYSFLCYIQQGLLAVPMGSGAGACGSTGTLPAPDSTAPPPPPPAVPAAPANVAAVPGDTRVTLTWSITAGATAYAVASSPTSGGPYQTIQAGVTTTSFVQTGLTNGTTYYYVVSASNTGGNGPDSSEVSATPVAPVTAGVNIWTPAAGATMTGTNPFQALFAGKPLSAYRMYWQVDGDRWNLMGNSSIGGAHKEALVNVDTWTWRGTGPYVVNFIATDNKGRLLGQKSVTIYVAH